MFDAQFTQHVVYIAFPGGANHIQELWWDIFGWHRHDLTAAAGTRPAKGPIAAYVFDAQATQHVVYVGLDSHVYELWWG